MKFIKKNASTIVAIIVFFAVLLGIFTVKKVFLSDEPMAIYGTRLDDRKDVEISNETKKKVEKKLSEATSKVKVRIAGRIINIYMKTNEDVNLETAKELGNKAIEEFSNKEKKYYDIQLLIENDKNTSQFPIMGYKHHTKDQISWTKDRVES